MPAAKRPASKASADRTQRAAGRVQGAAGRAQGAAGRAQGAAGRAQGAAGRAQSVPASGARVGDWVQTHGLPGKPSRRGQIVELLGSAEHERFRVRWDERHESIVYPADGVLIAPASKPARAPRARR